MMQKVARTVVVVALCLAAFRITASADEEKGTAAIGQHYKLGAQDKVAIKVYEWRPSRDEIYEWTAFKAEYVVSGSGFLSLPLLGDVQANGLTTAELSQDLGARLKERMGLMASPDVTVEVVQFRPFYIVGAIEKPGEYPYRPGLNVLEAYAIAGGRPRGSSARLEREAIATRGDLNAYSLETLTLRARMARLQAEITGKAEVKWPSKPEGQVSPALDRAIAQERLVFDMRRESYGTQITALEQLEAFLVQEAESLQKQLEVHKIEVASVKTELDMVETLFKKGLTAAPRKLALERNMAQVDGERLRLDSNLMRARQEISKTKIAMVDLKAKRDSELSTELQKTQTRLDELKSRMETSSNLLYETEVLAPQALSAEEGRNLPPVFQIVTKGNGSTAEQIVSQDRIVMPGDTIIVEQPRQYPQVRSLPMSGIDEPTASADILAPERR
jgi:polysaccharide export outer membrane protein/exopolysaccharide production protein ExoF